MNVVTVLDFGLAKALPDSLAAAVSSTVSTVVMRIFAIGTSRQLFPTSGVPPPGEWRYDVTRDGQRFLVSVPVDPGTPKPITVVLNWAENLRGR